MSAVSALRIRLGNVEVGSVFSLDDGRTFFSVQESYAADSNRPVLSAIFNASDPTRTMALLRNSNLSFNRGPGSGKLPPWFRGLLPEGAYRRHLLEKSNLREGNEIALLSFCGKDLPGAVTAEPFDLTQREIAALLTQGYDSYEASSDQLPTAAAASLSGIQPKAALWLDEHGRYVARGRFGASHFIGKLPGGQYANLPEIEFASLTLARTAGVQTCEFELRPQSDLDFDEPLDRKRQREMFLLVKRFDRDAGGGRARIHMEDMAQATGRGPEAKYEGSNAEMGLVLASAGREQDLLELVRRIKVNELLGNFDAHLKNQSLLYRDPRSPELAPAYDVVAYSMVVTGTGVGLLNFPKDPQSKFLTPATVRKLANAWRTNERALLETLKETVDVALTEWPRLLPELPLDRDHRKRFITHLEKRSDSVQWYKRHPLAARLDSSALKATEGRAMGSSPAHFDLVVESVPDADIDAPTSILKP